MSDSADKSDRDKLNALLFGPGMCFPLPKKFAQGLPAGEAILLAFLLDQSIKAGNEGGWFSCSKRLAKEKLFLSIRKTNKLFASLISTGVLETKRDGEPHETRLRINMDYSEGAT